MVIIDVLEVAIEAVVLEEGSVTAALTAVAIFSGCNVQKRKQEKKKRSRERTDCGLIILKGKETKNCIFLG